MIALCVYLAVFLNRRSRGLAASFFYASNGPDREETQQEDLDVVALFGTAMIVGTMVYELLKHW